MTMLGLVPNINNMGLLEWIIYFSFSTFTIIVNLNLLITIIGETYSKVSETSEQTNCRMQADLLHEIAGFKFNRRKAGSPTYLHLVQDMNEIDEDDINTDMRIKSLVESQENVYKMMKD